MRAAAAVASLSFLLASGCSSTAPEALRRQLELDHLFIVVGEGALERAALEAAGLNVGPQTYHHKGQGTSSVLIPFKNAYLELLWRDPAVGVEPAAEKLADQMVRRREWRTSGVAPFGIGLRRRPGAPAALPLPSERYHAEWMAPGEAIDIIAGPEAAPMLFVVPPSMAFDEERVRTIMVRSPQLAATFSHPLGVAKVTNARLVLPPSMLPEHASLVSAAGLVELRRGGSAVLELTFDDGRQRKQQDFRPGLPLVIHY